LVSLEWSQVDFNAGNLHVRRLKGSTGAVHPIRGDELRALRRLQREQEPKSSFVFTSGEQTAGPVWAVLPNCRIPSGLTVAVQYGVP